MKILFKKMKQIIAVTICISLLCGMTVYADTKDDIEDTKNQIDDLQQQKEDAEGQVNDLQNHKSNLESELSSLNSKLGDISSSLEDIQAQIEDKNQEISDTEAALEQAEQQAAQQYEDMKKRIQFMYENGSDTLVELVFSAQSISDMLNKAEYVEELSSYDRNMLAQYEQTQADIAAQKSDLETQKADLADLEASMKSKQSQVNSLIANTKTSISQSESDISNAEDIAETLQAQIDQQKAYEAQLEIQKAQEDAARLEEIKKEEEENTAAPVVITESDGDLTLLAALIYCEAGGESYEGQVAVGSVVMNRVRSSYYPNTVSGVIYQSGQFSPVASGRLATVLAQGLTTSSCTQAAQYVLAGNTTNNFLYFRSNNGIISGTVIGNQVFY